VPRRHEEEEHEEHENHEAWVIPYADMLTLLMAMFLMLYAVGTIDMQKFQALAGAFRQEIAGEKVVIDPGIATDAGQGVLSGTASAWPISSLVGSLTGRGDRMEAAQALAAQQAEEAARAVEAARFDEVEAAIREQVEALGFASSVEFRRTERGLLITVLTDEVLFTPGSAMLEPKSTLLLDELAEVFKPLPNAIEIVGHTDTVPIRSAQFPSNWELSTGRAGSVVRYFIDRLGFPPERLRSSGLADTQPIDTNATPEGRARNRRVEITVLTAVGDTAPAPAEHDATTGAA